NSVQQSISNSQKTLELGGDAYATSYSIAGRALLVEAQYKILMGEDPGDLLPQSIEKTLQALKLGSNEPLTLFTDLINDYYTQAEFNIDKKVDASKAFENAWKFHHQATSQLHDAQLDIWASKLEILDAKWQTQKGRSPELSLSRANDLLQAALKQDPADADLFTTLAEFMEVKAEWLQKNNQPFDEEFSQGLSFTKKALQINPKLAEAFIVEGKLYRLKNSVDRARQSFEQAFAINSNLKKKYFSYVEKSR
ncbi:hypothetical protein L0152_21650, partial [bacterium]|nr:hypothetical protein [bacterium]